ncbi:acetyl-CoA carboxylase biotin carboxyl carrier protein subunit [Bacteroidia bacterium]|nr:acetyl-CoA carboxylase biotin carboxyl carrier protein subunit [Bacteroidia bacterium]GHV32709.1 acetyl-CoA carboxylase biotin carboxyl carrier protein subunit [Bacteroidia bacterium]
MKSFKYTINGSVYKVVINSIEDTIAEVEVNGTPYTVEMNKPTKKEVVTIKRPAQTTTPPVARLQTSLGQSALKSPLPGVILDITCKVGDTVKKGQKVIVLEAMKMENAINSDRDGVIKEVKVNKGDSVLEGADLIIIE